MAGTIDVVFDLTLGGAKRSEKICLVALPHKALSFRIGFRDEIPRDLRILAAVVTVLAVEQVNRRGCSIGMFTVGFLANRP